MNFKRYLLVAASMSLCAAQVFAVDVRCEKVVARGNPNTHLQLDIRDASNPRGFEFEAKLLSGSNVLLFSRINATRRGAQFLQEAWRDRDGVLQNFNMLRLNGVWVYNLPLSKLQLPVGSLFDAEINLRGASFGTPEQRTSFQIADIEPIKCSITR